MNLNKLELLSDMYEEVKKTDSYASYLKKLKTIPVFKKIIWETLKNDPIENDHLSGLIQLFKHNCSNETFDNYLERNIPDNKIRKIISDEAYSIGENGFTNAGKQAIQTLTNKELQIVKLFLLNAFKITTVEEGVLLCNEFCKLNIPIVSEGVYSPWLFYINPYIFPLVNGGIKGFKSWINLSKNYAENINEFKLISDKVGESNLGLIDALTSSITSTGKLNLFRKLVLDNKRLYKISHGVFTKRTDFVQSGILKILENNKWISLSRYTGKGAGNSFENELQIGDFVYLCYGGDKILYVAEVISEAKLFESGYAELLNDDEEEWIYREVKPLYYPLNEDIIDLKSYRSQTMPSGNSTFWEIKERDLEALNDTLFIPKLNLEILKRDNSEFELEKGTINHTIINTPPMSLNTILFGPPGTGKTYNTINKSIEIANPSFDLSKDRSVVKKEFERLMNEGQIVFTTFHQSMSYEDFIEGIKPVLDDGQSIQYDIEPGIFKSLALKAKDNWFDSNKGTNNELSFEEAYSKLTDEWVDNQEMKFPLKRQENSYTIIGFTKSSIKFKKASGGTQHTLSISTLRDYYYNKREIMQSGLGVYYPSLLDKLKSYTPTLIVEKEEKKYVLIIDEINRGNVSQIFGELITLIEEDKRLGEKEALEVTLPYSKEKFGVPPNLYIIGTMNTADRSVEALDTALRRRFSFEEMPPKYELGGLRYDFAGINISLILQTINNRVEKLLDKDHAIGHSYFLLKNDENSDSKLVAIFYNNIIPLLQEYFFGDYGKIGLVLGNGFIYKKVWETEEGSFADFDSVSASDFDERDVYEIIDYRDIQTKYNINIKGKNIEMNFEKAIKLLMKEEID